MAKSITWDEALVRIKRGEGYLVKANTPNSKEYVIWWLPEDLSTKQTTPPEKTVYLNMEKRGCLVTLTPPNMEIIIQEMGLRDRFSASISEYGCEID